MWAGSVWMLRRSCDVSVCTVVLVRGQLFDTLTETMQGPCEGNQALLSHSQVLEALELAAT